MNDTIRQLMPGATIDADGTLRIDVVAMLSAARIRDTPANREMLTQAAIEVLSEDNPDARVEVVQ